MPVSGLFRDQIDPERRWPRKRYLAALAVSVAALVGLSLLAAYDRRIALMFVGAAAGSFVLLRLVALGIMALARRLPASAAERRRGWRSPTSTARARSRPRWCSRSASASRSS